MKKILLIVGIALCIIYTAVLTLLVITDPQDAINNIYTRTAGIAIMLMTLLYVAVIWLKIEETNTSLHPKPITIHNLSTASAQEVYNYICYHLLEQAGYSSSGGKCSNRLESRGRVFKCAAGCLIPDEYYEQLAMQEGSWDDIVEVNSLNKHHLNLILKLQEIHDKAASNKYKKKKLLFYLLAVGKTYQLNPEFLDYHYTHKETIQAIKDTKK